MRWKQNNDGNSALVQFNHFQKWFSKLMFRVTHKRQSIIHYLSLFSFSEKIIRFSLEPFCNRTFQASMHNISYTLFQNLYSTSIKLKLILGIYAWIAWHKLKPLASISILLQSMYPSHWFIPYLQIPCSVSSRIIMKNEYETLEWKTWVVLTCELNSSSWRKWKWKKGRKEKIKTKLLKV